ncbi:uncharacterized protein [Ptychodera flava]|uniref:uncharacterized protein n=1 Tax=Ptychodera flava TaxID=63121 RepID=UPI00396A3106
MDSNSAHLLALDFKKFIDYDDDILSESELSGDSCEYFNKGDPGLLKRSDSHEFSFDEEDFVTKPVRQSPQGEYLGLEPEPEIDSSHAEESRFIQKQSEYQNVRNVSEWLEHVHVGHQWSGDSSQEETDDSNVNDDIDTVDVIDRSRTPDAEQNLNENEIAEISNLDTGTSNVDEDFASQSLNEDISEDDTDDIEKMNRRNSPEMIYEKFDRNQWRSRSLQTPTISDRDSRGTGSNHDRSYSKQTDRARRVSASSSSSSNIDASYSHSGNDRRSYKSKVDHQPAYGDSRDFDRRNCHRRSLEKGSVRYASDSKPENKSAFTRVSEDNSAHRLRSGQRQERKHGSGNRGEHSSDHGSQRFSESVGSSDSATPRASTPKVGKTSHNDVTLYMSASPVTDEQRPTRSPRRKKDRTSENRKDHSHRNDHHGNTSYDEVPNHEDSNNNQVARGSNRTFPPSLVLALESYRDRREKSRDRETKSGRDSECDCVRPKRCASPSLARGRRSPVVEVIRHSLATVQSENVHRSLKYERDRFYIPSFSEFKEMRKSGMLPEFDKGPSEIEDSQNWQRTSSLRLPRERRGFKLDLHNLNNSDDFKSLSTENSPRNTLAPGSEDNSPLHTPRIGSTKQEDAQRAKDFKKSSALRNKVNQSKTQRHQSSSLKSDSEKTDGTVKVNDGSVSNHTMGSSDVSDISATRGNLTSVVSSKGKPMENRDTFEKPSNDGGKVANPGKTKQLKEKVVGKRNSVLEFEFDETDSVDRFDDNHGNIKQIKEKIPGKRSDVPEFEVHRTESVTKVGNSNGNKKQRKENIPGKRRDIPEHKFDGTESVMEVDNNSGNKKRIKDKITEKGSDVPDSKFNETDSVTKVSNERRGRKLNSLRQNMKDSFDSDDSGNLQVPIRRRLAVKQKAVCEENHTSEENATHEQKVDNKDPAKVVSNESSESDSCDSDVETCRENISKVSQTKKKKSVGSVIAEWTKDTMLTESDNARVRQEIQSVLQDQVEPENKKQREHISSIVSNCSVDSGIGTTTTTTPDERKTQVALPETKQDGKKDNGIERTDSGVGSENGDSLYKSEAKSGDSLEVNIGDIYKSEAKMESSTSITCEDCRLVLDLDGQQSMAGLTVCRKCEKRRVERKETIMEIVQTEISYGDDLNLILKEFYKPIKSAALLSDDQLDCVFLNLEELVKSNDKLADIFQDALDIASEEGDEEYTNVNLGKLILDNIDLFAPFEEYCINQATASVFLSTLESEKELLRVFLQVSQKENVQLRKLHLKSFLMSPVQRITKYPLLLSRLHKTTPEHHDDASAIKEAQKKTEEILEHINAKTQRVTLPGKSKNARRTLSFLSLNFNTSVSELKKLSLETLGWTKSDVKFLKIGRLQCSQPTDQMWQKVKKTDLQFKTVHVLLALHGQDVQNYKAPDEDEDDDRLLFPSNTVVKQAALVIFRDRTNEKFILHRDPIMLDKCVVSSELGMDELFEVMDMGSNDILVFKTDNVKETRKWIRYIRQPTKNLGGWRRRRNALANIMITSMARS